MSQSRDRGDRGNQPSAPLKGVFTPTLLAAGTTPPAVTITEAGFLNASIQVSITLLGVLGVALYTVTVNGVPSAGLTTLASVAVPGFPSAFLHFSAGTYAADNVYTGVA
jgi:hypothetical protein